jgi:peroxiredoxin
MKAWAKQGDAAGITMLADGNADFARALGLSTDSSKFGMGIRSQRYSMLVEDGVVKQLNVEQPGEFRVSSGDYLLGAL